ncbi:MAG TPA: GspH/FimT family pseudopilin [Thermoanaerobaculia bacterium]|nr:GspH/FimT family pseudopilin [Thermoanaerobaculia bacterium]
MRRTGTAMRGYSLTEALVVVAIIGVISLVSIPNFMAMYRSMKIKGAVRQLTSDIRAARQEAVTRYRPVMVSFGTTAAEKHSYWIHLWNPTTSQWVQRKAAVLEPETTLANRTVYFTAIGFPDAMTPAGPGTDDRNEIIFESTGAVRNPPVNPTLRVRTDVNITKNEFILTVSPSGSVRVD